MIDMIRRARRTLELTSLRGAPHIEVTVRKAGSRRAVGRVVVPIEDRDSLERRVALVWQMTPECAAVAACSVDNQGVLCFKFRDDGLAYALDSTVAGVVTWRAWVLGQLARVALLLLPG